MIDDNILTLAGDHAEALKAKGFTVSAKANTPVGDLVSYYKAATELSWTSIAPPSVSNTTKSNSNPEHDFGATLSGVADAVADYIRGYLDFARNTAKAALEDLQKKVTQALTASKHEEVFNPMSGFDVVQIGSPDILENPEFLSGLSHYNSGNTDLAKEGVRYGARTTEQLIESCMTGNAQWDTIIQKWLSSLDGDKLQTVWQSLFMDKVANNPTVDIIGGEWLLQDYMTGGCSALIAYLLAARLEKDITDEAGVPLAAARDYLYSLLQACVAYIQRSIEWGNSFITTSSLVVSTDRRNRKVMVNKAVYKQFLKDGGRVDVLMGMLVANKSYNTVGDLNAHAEELLSAWNSYVLSRDFEAQSAFDQHLRFVMTFSFEESLKTPIGPLETEQLAKPGVRETALAMFKQLIEGYSPNELRVNWSEYLWRSACKARFHYHTTTYDLLDAIDHAVRVEGRAPENATTMAVMKVVPLFVADMLTAEHIK